MTELRSHLDFISTFYKNMTNVSAREKEARIIRRASRAAAVGQLMLGKLSSWHEFLEADAIDLENLPRRYLKSAVFDVKGRLSREIRMFCSKNFLNMDEQKLSLLYEDIKAYRGLELPLKEFEAKFATVRRDILKGNPAHLTIVISLWGLQFMFPEDELAKDLVTALHLIATSQNELNQFIHKNHAELEARRMEVATLIRKKMFAVRSAVLCCFNLMEAYLNGLAWDYVKIHGSASLSNQQRKLLEDTASASIRDKLWKYPQIISGRELWKESDEDFEGFIGILKPYRDSLVHPSPFSAPEKFGGYDKLRLFYRIDHDTAVVTAELLVCIIQRVHKHLFPDVPNFPEWICYLESEIKDISAQLLT